MTPAQYIAEGFQLSAHVEQAAITLAENDVTAAYLDPIIGSATLSQTSQAVVRLTKMRLAFMLLSERNTKETRAGAKLKNSVNSQSVGISAVIEEMSLLCHLAVEAVRALPDVEFPKAKVTDICKIYFESNFIHS